MAELQSQSQAPGPWDGEDSKKRYEFPTPGTQAQVGSKCRIEEEHMVEIELG